MIDVSYLLGLCNFNSDVRHKTGVQFKHERISGFELGGEQNDVRSVHFADQWHWFS